MVSHATKLHMSDMCVCLRGVGEISHGPARLASLSCLAQSADPYNFCS